MADLVDFRRIISDLRCGLPIILGFEDSFRLVFASESLDTLPSFDYILISSPRSKFLGYCDNDIRVASNEVGSAAELIELISSPDIVYDKYVKADEIDSYIIKIMKLAQLLPSAIVLEADKKNISKYVGINISIEMVRNYFNASIKVKKISQGPITLRRKHDSEMFVFRSEGIDHHCIVIRGIRANPLVRLHSSCYTGDILGVLTCDCGDQLRYSINHMLDNSGGIILYLNQEGRGIGLANKIRAYDLQSSFGLDTVEANNVLGFEDDERDFEIAAEILKNMGIRVLRLLTSNPIKLEFLKSRGIVVTECENIFVPHNTYNARYMNTKINKMGHSKKSTDI